jgi:hypothetical protein
MAKGWESKSIESQQEEAQRRRAAKPGAAADPHSSERRTLELAKIKAESDLRSAVHPAHKKMLQQALADLDARLRQLAPTTPKESEE